MKHLDELKKMTVKELKEYALSRKIEIPSDVKLKADVVEHICDNQLSLVAAKPISRSHQKEFKKQTNSEKLRDRKFVGNPLRTDRRGR